MSGVVPRVIVVASPEVFSVIANSGLPWDPQYPVPTVTQMWDDLSANRLDQASRALIFSSEAGSIQDIAAAVAVMAPHAPVAVIAADEAEADNLRGTIARAQVEHQQPSAPFTICVSPTTGRALLEQLRDPWRQVASWPQTFPASADVELLTQQPVAQWNPQQAPPAPAYTQPLAPAPDYTQPLAPAPVHAPPPPAPAPAPVQAPPPPAPAYTQPHAPAQGTPTGELLDQPPLPGQLTLTITSAKGGSGKTTVAACIAATIAQASAKAGQPKRVVLVDMDTRDSQVGSIIGKWMPTALNIRVQPKWDKDAILAHLVHSEELGIDVLLAPVRPRSADNVGPEFYRHVIRSLQRTHDVVVMDTSVNYLDPLISTVCLPEASAILIVTTLAATSVHGMARALREILEPVDKGGMGIPRQRVGIVVNQAVAGVGMDIDQVITAALKVPVVGAVPLATTDVLAATNSGQLHTLLTHPRLGPSYFALAQACLPQAALAPLVDPDPHGRSATPNDNNDSNGKRGGLFRRTS